MNYKTRICCAVTLLSSFALFQSCGGSACPEGFVAKGALCQPFWGGISGTITLAGQADSSGVVIAVLGTDAQATTDSSGSFVLGPLTAGSYVLQAKASGYTTGRFPVTVRDGQTAAITGSLPLNSTNNGGGDGGFTSEETGSISGVVTLKGRSDHSGILIVLLGTDRIASTGASGSFAIGGVPMGSYTLQAICTGFTTTTLSANVVIGDNVTVTGELSPSTFTNGGSDGGAVSNAPGSVAGSAYVLGRVDHSGITVTLTGGPTEGSASTTTATDGAYQFTGVPGGIYMLTFASAGMAPQSQPNVIVGGGRFQATEVTLSAAVKLSEKHLTGAGFLPDSAHAIVVVSAGGSFSSSTSYLYTTETKSFAPIAEGAASYLAGDASGRYAYVLLNGSVQQLDTTNRQLAPMSPAGVRWVGALGQTGYYATARGDIYSVALTGNTGSLFMQLPLCTNAQLGSFQPLGSDSIRSHWYALTFNGTCGDSGASETRLLQDTGGTMTGLASRISYSPDNRYALVLELANPTQPSGVSTLKRIDLTTGAMATLQSNVSYITVDSKWRWSWLVHDVDGAGFGTYASLEPTHGNVIDLASNATLYNQNDPQLLTIGASGGAVKFIRVDLGTAVTVCPALGQLRGDASSLLGCSGPSSTGFAVFDVATNRATTLTTAAVSSISFYRRGVLWTEGGVRKGFHALGTGPVTLCGSTYTHMGASADGQSVVYGCYVQGSTYNWQSTNLRTGASFDIASSHTLTGYLPGNSCQVASNGAALCYYGAGSLAPGLDCAPGSNYCFIASNATGRAISAGDYYNRSVWSADESALVQTSGDNGVRTDLAVFSGTTPTLRALSNLPAGQSFSAIGNQGTSLLYQGSSGVSASLYNVANSMSTTLPNPKSAIRLATSNDYLVGDSVVKLDSGAIVTLGNRISDVRQSTDGLVLTYLDGTSRTMYRYTTDGGVLLLAGTSQRASSSTINGMPIYYTGISGNTGGLSVLNTETGSLNTLVPQAALTLATASEAKLLAFGSVSTAGDTAEVLAIDTSTGSVTDLGARALLPFVRATNSERVTFAGVDTSGAQAVFVAKYDGTATRRLGATPSSITFTGDRVSFTAVGARWLEASGTNASIALCESAGFNQSPYISPDGHTVLFDYKSSDYPEIIRNGTYVVTIP